MSLTKSQVRHRELKLKAEKFDEMVLKIEKIENTLKVLMDTNPNNIKQGDIVFIYGAGCVDKYEIGRIVNNGTCMVYPVRPSWDCGWNPTHKSGSWVPLSMCSLRQW